MVGPFRTKMSSKDLLEEEDDGNGMEGSLNGEDASIPHPLYREIDSEAFSDDSTWMNLGLWEHSKEGGTGVKGSKSRFTEANERLATRIGDLALILGSSSHRPPISTVIDLGCGKGDSLALWASRYGQVKRVIGVNSSKSEYLYASERFRGEKKISLHFSDALEFVKRDLQLKDFAIVSVDAAYHFTPSREAFLTACRSSDASRLALSDIVLSERWARENGRMDFLTLTFRKWFIQLICWSSGIPLTNLSYGPVELVKLLDETGWRRVHFETVTDKVFGPFADYCNERAKQYSWFSKPKWTLLSSGLFMRLLSWLEAVDFVIYAAEPK